MWVYTFEEGSADMRNILGGKGSALAEMTRIGLPIPPGIIISTSACKEYFSRNGDFPPGLLEEVFDKLKFLEKKTGRTFGSPNRPLLVSVRSGAPVSMPGMMDTILNLGLNDETVRGFSEETGDERFAYDCYRRFIQIFGDVVLKVPREKFNGILEEERHRSGVKSGSELDVNSIKRVVQKYKSLVVEFVGKNFPADPKEQLQLAIKAVFESWNSKRAVEYRLLNNIPDDLGTAVTIQVMVFGNRGPNSGTGVVFTRSPSTGEKTLYGEYILNAQGEDLVAGIRTPKPIEELKRDIPHLFKQLVEVTSRLEWHFRDMQDIEFTIEEGTLYILQTRKGKRTAQAAVKIVVDMAREGIIPSKEEAILRFEPDQIKHLLHRQIDPKAEVKPIARGLAASPGAASGIAVFSIEEAVDLAGMGKKVILVRPETIPEDMPAIIVSQGMLTSRGGMTCHAAVVAREIGKPAVVGCEEVRIDLENETFQVHGIVVRKHDTITIDGTNGYVYLGEVPTVEPELSGEARQLLSWADEVKSLKVRANADTPEAARMARALGAEGIGLCRTERMFNASDRLPVVQEMILADSEAERRKALAKLLPMQKKDFKEIFRAMAGLPITVRLLDLPLHEFLPKVEDLLVEVSELKSREEKSKELPYKERVLKRALDLKEHNPMLGHRGCRLSITYPEIYEMQSQAIFEAATELAREGVTFELEIMIPLVGEARELAFHRRIIEETAESVMQKAGIKVPYLIGTMIEVPRAALTAEKIAQCADFFSFGTNDLTQTTFAFSRDDAEAKFIQEYLTKGILESNPFEVLDRAGVGRLIQLAVEGGRAAKPGLKIGICGEHGGDPRSIEFFQGLGLNYVSCSPLRVPIAKLAAAQAKVKSSR